MMKASDPEIESLTRTFEELAGQSNKILGLASTIVECIESDSVRSVLPTVRALGSAGISFVESRLAATHGILETAATEVKVLHRLLNVTRSQSGIALRIRVLAMMTNIEMGRLGNSGAAFEYIAGTLNNFSSTLSEDTDELESRTGARGISIEATNRVLGSELPHLAEELVHIKAELGNDLTLLESDLAELGSIPVRFKAGVEEIAARIGGAVAAIQAYDITRQQIEHVQEATAKIAAQIRPSGKHRNRDSPEWNRARVGITIQICQLQHIRETVSTWMSRIRDCPEVLLNVSTSNLAGISPIVSAREHEISARLAHFETLETKSKAQSELICQKVGEHTSLVRLIDGQVKKAAATRQTLHLLSLNTTLEADRLGAQANAVLEIGRGISDLSLEWSKITDQSGQALQEISELVSRIDDLTLIFSESEDGRLQKAQRNARVGLQRLKAISEFAATQACEIDLRLEAMRVMADGITKSVDVLARSYRQIDSILNGLQDLQLQFEADAREVHSGYDAEEMEQYFSASYTTEVEREVLRAALGGTRLLPAQQHLEGNGVELF